MTEDEYHEIMAPIIALSARKSEDYNSETSLEEYFPFGDISYMQMIHTKAQRLLNLTRKSSTINYESVEDTLVDLINYAVYYLKYLQEQNDERVGTKLYDPSIRGSEHG